jgi:hypothetical protein
MALGKKRTWESHFHFAQGIAVYDGWSGRTFALHRAILQKKNKPACLNSKKSAAHFGRISSIF